jgi:calcineurin-like phosphoesterase family protein
MEELGKIVEVVKSQIRDKMLEEQKAKGKRFFISDTHFNDERLNLYGRDLMFNSASEVNEYVILRWNETVGKDDLVYHLGDVSFISDQYVDKLNGNIFLIRGNHDKPKYDYLFKEVVDLAEINIEEFKCIIKGLEGDDELIWFDIENTKQ